MSTRFYVGRKAGVSVVFSSDTMPTPERYSGEYLAVIGPFRTKRAALFMAQNGAGNPHLQTVADAERISKRLM